jgi:hypothetical protein
LGSISESNDEGLCNRRPTHACAGKETLEGHVEQRHAGREGCKRKKKRRFGLHPLERVVTQPPARAAP